MGWRGIVDASEALEFTLNLCCCVAHHRVGAVHTRSLARSGTSVTSIQTSSYNKIIDMNTVTVSPKFQVVIPLDVRRRMKLEPGAKLMVVEFNGGLRLVPLKPPSALRGIARGISAELYSDPDRVL